MIVLHVHGISWLHGGMHTCMILLKVHTHYKMMMVMIVMHVHEMSRWYDDMVVCVNATSIYVS